MLRLLPSLSMALANLIYAASAFRACTDIVSYVIGVSFSKRKWLIDTKSREAEMQNVGKR